MSRKRHPPSTKAFARTTLYDRMNEKSKKIRQGRIVNDFIRPIFIGSHPPPPTPITFFFWPLHPAKRKIYQVRILLVAKI